MPGPRFHLGKSGTGSLFSRQGSDKSMLWECIALDCGINKRSGLLCLSVVLLLLGTFVLASARFVSAASAQRDAVLYVDCSTSPPSLPASPPATLADCASAVGRGGCTPCLIEVNGTYDGGSQVIGPNSTATVYVVGGGPVRVNYTITDVTTHTILAYGFGTAPGPVSNTCSSTGKGVIPGTATSGAILSHGDRVSVTVNSGVAFCSGGASPTNFAFASGPLFTTTITTTTTATATITITTTATATTTSTTSVGSTTSSGLGSIPEFPYQPVTAAFITILLVASYLLARGQTAKSSHNAPKPG